jgi:tetratricopeptide (TPR) repeat protein
MRIATFFWLALLLSAAPAHARARTHSFSDREASNQIAVSADAQEAIQTIDSGDFAAGIEQARQIEEEDSDDPLGYLIEGEARWWEMYCENLDVKYGMIDAWGRSKWPGDAEYLALADKAVRLAEARIKENDSAEMHIYAGLGWALKARLYGLRFERRNTAHAGVEARAEFLRAQKLDASLADEDTGLGLYNYYIDTLSGFVKFLRFFMGIPGGSKKQGIAQLTNAMNHAVLTPVDARFYLAKNLRTYDFQYERALEILQPLVEQYPRNPIFLLLRGNFYAELGRTELAAADFRTAENLDISNAECAAHVKHIAEKFLGMPQ